MSENTRPNGRITWVHLNDDGSTSLMTASEVIASVMKDEVRIGMDDDGVLWAEMDGVFSLVEVDLGQAEQTHLSQGATNDDYLWMIDDKGKFRSWEDDSELDYRADFKYPFQKGYTREQSHLAAGPGSWL